MIKAQRGAAAAFVQIADAYDHWVPQHRAVQRASPLSRPDHLGRGEGTKRFERIERHRSTIKGTRDHHSTETFTLRAVDRHRLAHDFRLCEFNPSRSSRSLLLRPERDARRRAVKQYATVGC